MSDCQVTPEVAAILKDMAKSLVETGHSDPLDIIDRIHAEIQDHTPMWKSEIADAITDALPGRKRTASELTTRMNQLKKELRSSFHPKDKNAVQNKTRQADLQKQIAKMQDQLKTGDYSKPERSKPVYDQETKSLEKERDQLKRKVDKEIRVLEYNSKSKTAKVVDTAFAYMRASILSGIHTIGKLSSAALSRIVLTTPAEEAIGSGLKHIPYISDIAAKAPREGGGFNLSAEGSALSHTFSKATLKEMKDTALTASGALDAMYGEDKYGFHKYLDVVGQIHGALKAPAKINEFYRSLILRSAHARNQLIAEGKSPTEADAIMQSAPAQAILTANAYKDGQRAIFMSDNQAVSAYKDLIGAMRRGPEGSSTAFFGGVGARTLEYLLPIVKVPTNVVAEAGSYALGFAKAVVQLAAAGGKEKLSPEQADYIMRNLKKQTLGAALMAVGYAVPSAIGGYYRGGTQYKDADEPAEGSLKLFGFEVPKTFLHTPAFEMLQIGATIRKMMDAGKGPLEGTYTGAQGLLGQVPFFDTPKRLVGAFRGTKSLGNYVNREVASRLVPAIVNDAATATDKEAVPRRASTLGEAIKLRVPVLREQVAPADYKKVKGASAKLSVYEKATDAQKKEFYDDLKKSIHASKSLTQKQKDAYQDRADAAYPNE